MCVCVVGTGKSSLITCLVKDRFRPTKIQPTLPPLTIGAPENVQTTIVDTSGVCVALISRGVEDEVGGVGGVGGGVEGGRNEGAKGRGEGREG